MLLNFIIVLLIIFLILFYFSYNPYNPYNLIKEKFVVCENKPDGPYTTYCSLIKFNDNTLSAYCKNITGSTKNNFVYSKLPMDNCSNQDDCNSVKINDVGELTC
jgi:hypothetical protein